MDNNYRSIDEIVKIMALMKMGYKVAVDYYEQDDEFNLIDEYVYRLTWNDMVEMELVKNEIDRKGL